MTCTKCYALYTQVGNPDDGYARSICACEREQKCFKCKRGESNPVNQAILDLDDEVRWYACAKHGHLEAEHLEPPEVAKPPVEKKVAAPTVKRTVVMSNLGPGLRGNTPWTKETWASNMEAVYKELKGPGQDYKVVCSSDKCSAVHLFGKRKVIADNANFSFRIVCPKCGEDSYKVP